MQQGWIHSVIESLVIGFVLLLVGCKDNSSAPMAAGGRGSLSDPSIIPQVVYTLPADGGTGPFKVYNRGPGLDDPHFVVQFNKFMNVASISESTITCKGFPYPVQVVLWEPDYYYGGRGRAAPDGSLKKSASPFKDIIDFTILRQTSWDYASYELGKSYTVTISPFIEDVNGNHLQQSYSFTFTPEPQFRVVGTFPADGTQIDNSAVASATVIFNAPVTSQILTKTSTSSLLTGAWKVSDDDSSRVLFSADSGKAWGFGKTIDLVVGAGAQDANGNTLPAEYRSRFTTMPFRAVGANIADGEKLSVLWTTIYLEFSGRVDASTISSSVTITPAWSSPQTSYYGPNELWFSPISSGWRANETYTITVGTSIKAADGTPLQEPYVLRFSTPPFRITSTYPSNGSVLDPRNSLEIYTDSDIDPSTIRSSMIITPPTTVGITYNAYYLSYWDTNGFATNTTYSVVISTSLRSLAGDTLATPYSFSFRTGP